MHYQPKQDLLQGRIILVTGASDGIGREAAQTYARYGATVILLGVTKKNCVRLPALSPMKTEHNHSGLHWIYSPVLLKNVTSLRSALPHISRVWMAYCITPDYSAIFVQ